MALERPLSVLEGKNSSEPIRAILDLHFPDAETAIDPTWGKGVFWRGLGERIQVTGGDIEPGRSTHYVGDCRSLPFPDQSFDIGVLDPPFIHDLKGATGTKLHDDYRGIGTYRAFLELVYEASKELRRVCRRGFIIKCKDSIECGKYRAIHAHVIADVGDPTDILVFVPKVHLANDPKWKTVQHFRRQESYFLVYVTGKRRRANVVPRADT